MLLSKITAASFGLFQISTKVPQIGIVYFLSGESELYQICKLDFDWAIITSDSSIHKHNPHTDNKFVLIFDSKQYK